MERYTETTRIDFLLHMFPKDTIETEYVDGKFHLYSSTYGKVTGDNALECVDKIINIAVLLGKYEVPIALAPEEDVPNSLYGKYAPEVNQVVRTLGDLAAGIVSSRIDSVLKSKK
jgi:hypothetical protein